MSAAQDLTGTVLDGRYRLTRLMGQGGMGEVYEAIHDTLDRKLAVKVLLPRFAYDPRFRDRFLREAKAASRVRHPNVVQILDFGDTPNGSVYFAMELLTGRDLRELLHQEGPLPWPRARHLLLQITAALAAAHERKVIHRDLKPANFFIIDERGFEDFVKVLDFGIAKIAADPTQESVAKSLTGTGQVFGTAKYMAPEQAYGSTEDPRVDVYSVGVVAYEMLTGTIPFDGASAFEIITRHVNEQPRPPREHDPSIPSAVEAVILKALAKKAEDRFPSMEALEQAWAEIPADVGTRGRLSPSLGPSSRPSAPGRKPALGRPITPAPRPGRPVAVAPPQPVAPPARPAPAPASPVQPARPIAAVPMPGAAAPSPARATPGPIRAPQASTPSSAAVPPSAPASPGSGPLTPPPSASPGSGPIASPPPASPGSGPIPTPSPMPMPMPGDHTVVAAAPTRDTAIAGGTSVLAAHPSGPYPSVPSASAPGLPVHGYGPPAPFGPGAAESATTSPTFSAGDDSGAGSFTAPIHDITDTSGSTGPIESRNAPPETDQHAAYRTPTSGTSTRSRVLVGLVGAAAAALAFAAVVMLASPDDEAPSDATTSMAAAAKSDGAKVEPDEPLATPSAPGDGASPEAPAADDAATPSPADTGQADVPADADAGDVDEPSDTAAVEDPAQPPESPVADEPPEPIEDAPIEDEPVEDDKSHGVGPSNPTPAPKPRRPLTDSQVRSRLAKKLARSCKSHASGTKVAMELLVGSTGKVLSKTAKTSNAPLKQCLMAEAAKASFPDGDTRTITLDVSL